MKNKIKSAAVLLPVLFLLAVFALAIDSYAQSNDLCSKKTPCGNVYITYLGDNLSLRLLICNIFDCRPGSFRKINLNESGQFDRYSDIKLDSLGVPSIAYVLNEDTSTTTVSKINFIKCGDRLCKPNLLQENEVIIQDNLGIGDISLDINSLGFPIISYHDESLEDLKIVSCLDTNCDDVGSVISVDSQGDSGNGNKIISHGTRDGMPIVVYLESDDLKFIHCSSLDCSSFDSPVILDAPGNTSSLSIDLDPQNILPSIVYDDTFDKSLKFIKCLDYRCLNSSSPIILDNHGDFASYPSLTFGIDRNPIISYGLLNGELKVIHCNDPYCQNFNSPVTLDLRGGRNSINIAKNNMPIISYFYPPTSDLRFINCTSFDCSTFYPPITLDSSGSAGNYNSMKSK